ncbi:SDR family oxidoreductase [Herbiconiux sp. 11R-BC]|uniref:SDR family oxidoreductase n=1 Tax=Herbiconiux sp. 11R-BC TaxID=3111637 RepID=UPI003C00645D
MKIAVAGGTGAVGRHVVDAARERGHEVVVLSRAVGVDLAGAAGSGAVDPRLAGMLGGAAAVIDVTSVQTQSAAASERFFGTVTRTLLAAEEAAGVGHHLALSIVGSDRAPFGYYAGKALQERLVGEGRIPFTILRATQFHEFAQQLLGQFSLGPVSVVPTMVSQPVAAREVGEKLVLLAEGGAAGRAPDLAGPEVLRMADMVRSYAAAAATPTTAGRRRRVLEVPLPGGFGKALRDGTLLAGPAAELGRQRFAEWVDEQRRPAGYSGN